MTLGHTSWQDVIGSLPRDAALAPFAREAAAVVMAGDGARVLAANALAQGAIGADGSFGEAARDRLRLLAQGLAPLSGVRLERLRLAAAPGALLVTCACRRIQLATGEEGLLILSRDLALAAPRAAVEGDDPAEAAAPSVAPQAPAVESPLPRRILWECDAEGRITSLSPAFASLLGWEGEGAHATWADLTAAGSLEAPGLAEALERGVTWSLAGVRFHLPDGRIAHVDLSGTPVTDSQRARAGYRGFGLLREVTAREDVPVQAPADVLAPSTPAAPAQEPTGGGSFANDDHPHSGADQPAERAQSSLSPTPSLSPMPSLADITAHMPALRPAEPTPAEPAKADAAESTRIQPVLMPAKAALSRAERSAFREIAKALGARIEGDDEAASPETETSTSPQDTPAAPPSAPVIPLQPRIQPSPPREREVAAEAGDSNHFSDLLDKLPIGVLVNRGETVIYANRTLLDLLGYDDLAHLTASGGLARLFRGARPREGSGAVMLVASDGEGEAVDARLSAIAWRGQPATLMAFRRATDVDASAKAKALELDVKAREERLQELTAVLDTATDGVVTMDAQGRILSLNKTAEALFGYDQREVTGENFTMLLAPESHLPASDYLEGLKGGGVASVLNDGREVFGRVRQGGRAPLFMTLGRIADGEQAKFCAVLRDITAWKTAEKELTEARKAAERASAQKSDVLAKISHEIRTPLNAIIGFSEVMAEERFGPIGNERYKEYLRDIRDSGGYVISLVNDLLDLAKIEAGKLDLDFTSVSLNDIATSAVALLQPEAGRSRVVLRSGLSPKLPPVVADQRSLRQIIINLLSNAVKFTEAGGQVIVSTALGDKGEAILRVRDTGIGMTEKELQLALEPFRQVSTTRRGGGTGLGLPLTKALVEANRGAFVITSVKDEGTLVEVIFPPQRVLAS